MAWQFPARHFVQNGDLALCNFSVTILCYPAAVLETAVDSFVLRFVHELPGSDGNQGAPTWHGIIRHVQTDAELRFTDIDDALTFIAAYVPLPAPDEQPVAGEGQT